MKAVSGFCVFVCILFCASSLLAQDSAFTAKAGLVAARQAADEAGYADAYLVSIHTSVPLEEDVYTYDEEEGFDYWNGKSHHWNYTFFFPQDSSYYNFKVNGLESGFIASASDLPDNLDTSEVIEGWIDSDGFSNAIKEKKRRGLGNIIRLSYDSYLRFENLSDRITWRSESHDSWTIVDAYTGKYLGGPIVGIESYNYGNNLVLYPNPSSSNITITLNNSNYTSIGILGLYGETLTSLKIPEGSDNFTVPIANFPSSGRYFLRLQGGKTVNILPVTIYR